MRGVYHHADGSRQCVVSHESADLIAADRRQRSRYVGEWKDDQKEGRAMEEWAGARESSGAAWGLFTPWE